MKNHHGPQTKTNYHFGIWKNIRFRPYAFEKEFDLPFPKKVIRQALAEEILMGIKVWQLS